jgi:hypothetical protein
VKARETVVERFLDTRWWPVILRHLRGGAGTPSEHAEKAI